MLKIAWAVLHVVSLAHPQSGQFVRQPSKKPAEKCDVLAEHGRIRGSTEWGKCSETWWRRKKSKKSPEIKLSFQNKRLNTTVPASACAWLCSVECHSCRIRLQRIRTRAQSLSPLATSICKQESRMWREKKSRNEGQKRKTARGRRKTVVYFLAQSVKFMTSEICVLASPLRGTKNIYYILQISHT